VTAHLTAVDDFYGRLRLGPASSRREDLPNAAPRALTKKAQVRWLRAAERASSRDRAIAYAGLRIAEIVALDVGSATVSVPHAQRRRWATWSVTTGRTGGMSITWRRASPTTSAPVRSFAQQRHDTGAWSTTTSGSRAARPAPVPRAACPGAVPQRVHLHGARHATGAARWDQPPAASRSSPSCGPAPTPGGRLGRATPRSLSAAAQSGPAPQRAASGRCSCHVDGLPEVAPRVVDLRATARR